MLRRLNVESEAPHWVSSISVNRTDEDTARRIGTEANYWESGRKNAEERNESMSGESFEPKTLCTDEIGKKEAAFRFARPQATPLSGEIASVPLQAGVGCLSTRT